MGSSAGAAAIGSFQGLVEEKARLTLVWVAVVEPLVTPLLVGLLPVGALSVEAGELVVFEASVVLDLWRWAATARSRKDLWVADFER